MLWPFHQRGLSRDGVSLKLKLFTVAPRRIPSRTLVRLARKQFVVAGQDQTAVPAETLGGLFFRASTDFVADPGTGVWIFQVTHQKSGLIQFLVS